VGILISAFWLRSAFYGEFNILYPVHPSLKFSAALGLLAFEAGIIIGWLRQKYSVCLKRPKLNWFSLTSWIIPILLWLFGVLGSVIVFTTIGVPLFEDPMLRAQIGFESGIWKRLSYTFMPLACVELYALALARKRKSLLLLSYFVIMVTILIQVLITKKGFILLTILFLLIVKYKDTRLRLVSRINAKQITLTRCRTYLRFLACATLALTLISITLRNEPYSKFDIAIVRVTNLLAQSPNAIVGNYITIPTAAELIHRELKAIGATFRLSDRLQAVDTELTNLILGRYIEHGGLNPTVIGYGWIIGGMWGVALLSFFYGLLTARFYRFSLSTSNPCATSCSLLAIYVVFFAVQAFSPVDAFLDLGLSIIAYIGIHRALEEIMGVKVVYRSPSTQSTTSHVR